MVLWNTYFIIILCLLRQTNAVCSGLNADQTWDYPDYGYSKNPRPGIWYLVGFYFGAIGCESTNGQRAGFCEDFCPSGTTLAYIKTAKDWEDWKWLRGKVYGLIFSLKIDFFI